MDPWLNGSASKGCNLDSRRDQSPNFQQLFIYFFNVLENTVVDFFSYCFRKCIFVCLWVFFKDIKWVRMKSNVNVSKAFRQLDECLSDCP